MTIWVCNRRENCLSLECRVSHRNLLTQTRSAHFGLSRRVCGRVMAPKRARDDDGGIVGAKGPGSIAPSAAALDAPPPAPAPAGQDAERAADAVDAILAPSNPGDAAAKVLAAAIECVAFSPTKRQLASCGADGCEGEPRWTPASSSHSRRTVAPDHTFISPAAA